VLAIAAILFFGIAVVVTIRGIGELRDLLHSSKRRHSGE